MQETEEIEQIEFKIAELERQREYAEEEHESGDLTDEDFNRINEEIDKKIGALNKEKEY